MIIIKKEAKLFHCNHYVLTVTYTQKNGLSNLLVSKSYVTLA